MALTPEKERILNEAEVLVLAPRFPSINQPWMDTYLEQLQKAEINFAIATYIDRPDVYQEKVDRLGLLDHALSISNKNRYSILHFLTSIIRNPFKTFRRSRKLWSETGCERSFKTKAALTLRAFYVEDQLSLLPNIRLCHSHSLSMAYEVLPILRSNSIAMVLTFHGLEPSGVPQVAEFRRKAVFDYANKILVNTEFARRHAKNLGACEYKIEVIPQGLPVDDFPYFEREMPGRSDAIEVLTVGRYHRDKGQAYALLALKHIRRLGYNLRWNFVGVGPDRERLGKLAQRLGLEECAKFYQGVSSWQLLNLYKNSHIFVLPSLDNEAKNEHVETQGVVLQEAQATGCVPIATRVGGVPECINDNVDGLLIKDRSYRAISSALECLLSDPARWHSMHLKGRENVEARFSADLIGKRMAEILRLEIQNGSR